jgi:NAD(P)-dependent dehydrogenase (short-subunit alcohol dehydrogenase family)
LSLERETDYLSLLINNAGIGGSGHSIEETSIYEIKELFDVHCCGAIRCLQAALPFLRKAEQPTVVKVSSRVGSIRMAKAAQNMLSASIHQELRGTGIAVFAIHPGKIRTQMSSPDADITAKQAAKTFVSWLPKIRQEQDFGYFQAGAEELPF